MRYGDHAPIPAPLPPTSRESGKVGTITTYVVSLICWPFGALCAMLGLAVLHHEQFPVPAVGYWGSFLVVIGLELLKSAATFTSDILQSIQEKREQS